MDTKAFIATLSVCATVLVASNMASRAQPSNSAGLTPVMDAANGVEAAGLTPSCPCPGDADCNGVVNFDDITTVLGNFGVACQ